MERDGAPRVLVLRGPRVLRRVPQDTTGLLLERLPPAGLLLLVRVGATIIRNRPHRQMTGMPLAGPRTASTAVSASTKVRLTSLSMMAISVAIAAIPSMPTSICAVTTTSTMRVGTVSTTTSPEPWIKSGVESRTSASSSLSKPSSIACSWRRHGLALTHNFHEGTSLWRRGKWRRLRFATRTESGTGSEE